MNKLFLAVASVLISRMTAPLLMAEDASLPPPKAPFVTAPLYAEWTITCTPQRIPPAPATTGNKGHATPLNALKEIRVTKAAKDRHEVSIWTNGQTSELWFFRGMILVQEPGSAEIHIFQTGNSDPLVALLFADYSKYDFPELSWVNMETYGGVKTYSTRLCYLFQRPSSPVSNREPKLTAERVITSSFSDDKAPPDGLPPEKGLPGQQVWVDGNTHLPVAMNDGTTLRTYIFREIPQQQLELPLRFAQALKQYQEALNEQLLKYRMKL